MGSQYRPDAPQPVDNQRRTKGEDVQDFSDYILEMTPEGWGHLQRTPAPSPRDKDGRERANDREAMRFFSESHMR